ncbi:MAG: hypothetical protein H6R05_805 [Burkholderiaceae bacterium]|nr:hypothetical protein [Burkholderiaceae bacterium]
MLAQTVSKNCIKKPLSTRFRIGVAGGLVLVACSLNVWAEPATNRYLQSRLIQTDEVGNVVIQTRKGDSLRVIAQQYSRVNNIPFARALEILQSTNASQFPNGDADQMLIGTRLVLPAKNQNSEPIAAVVPPPASVAETASSVGVSPSATSETTSNTPSAVAPSNSAQTLDNNNDNATVATLKQTFHSLRVQLNQFENKLQAQIQDTAVAPYYAKLKSWFLAVPASLWLIIIPTILLIWMVARLTRRFAEPEIVLESKDDGVQSSLSKVEPAHEHIVNTDRSESLATTETPAARVPEHVIEGWTASARTEPAAAVLSTAMGNEHGQTSPEHSEHKAVLVASQDAGVPAVQDNPTTSESAISQPRSTEAPLPASTEPTQTEITETTTPPSFDKLKQVLNGLTADQLDLRSIKTNHHANQSSQDLSEKTTDVNAVLQQYAKRVTATPAEHTIQYGVFKERARLQKWMHALSPEQLLSHAQSAHQQAQGEVAQYILNEVLLRGDAAQCTQALDLRHAWLTPTHRQTNNEAK